MSRNKQRDTDTALPLPRPRSPRHLDKKILAHARANAPKKARPGGYGWMGGLAAAGIVGIAVLIAVPEQTAPRFDALPEPLEESLPATSQDMPGKSAPAAAAATATATATASMRAELEDKPTASPKPKAKMRPRQDYDRAAGAATEEAAARAMREVELYLDARPADAAKKEMIDAEVDAALALPAAKEARSATLGKEQISAALELCAALLQTGTEAEAENCYSQLWNLCRDCDLPDTLQEALSRQVPENISPPELDKD